MSNEPVFGVGDAIACWAHVEQRAVGAPFQKAVGCHCALAPRNANVRLIICPSVWFLWFVGLCICVSVCLFICVPACQQVSRSLQYNIYGYGRKGHAGGVWRLWPYICRHVAGRFYLDTFLAPCALRTRCRLLGSIICLPGCALRTKFRLLRSNKCLPGCALRTRFV